MHHIITIGHDRLTKLPNLNLPIF